MATKRPENPIILCACGCGNSLPMYNAQGRRRRFIDRHWTGQAMSPIDRFWRYVDKTPASGCWFWTGGTQRYGYGAFHVGRRVTTAHRWLWIRLHGDPGDLHVLHKCDTPRCVNPDHLYIGTRYDNMRDKETRGRGNHPRTLTEDQVRAIRASTISNAALAASFNVAASTISRIRSGIRRQRG